MIIGVCSGLILYGIGLFSSSSVPLLINSGSIERVTAGILVHIVIYIIGIVMYIKLKRVKIDLSIREWQVICVIIGSMLVEIVGCHFVINNGKLTQSQKKSDSEWNQRIYVYTFQPYIQAQSRII